MTPSALFRAARGGAAAWAVVRVGRTALDRRRVDAIGDDEPPDGTVITVVIPARDEAGRIGPLLDALDGAPGVARVIVVDDESSDGTAELAAQRGVSVVSGVRRPAGWAGKTWAIEQGVRAAAGDWIVLLDADVRPTRGLPASLVARAIRDDLDLVSVATVARLAPGARALHASMLATLVYRFGGPGGSRRDRVLANGQCLAVRRRVLDGVGGFASVADEVVEDVALARRVAANGGCVAFLEAGDAASVEPGSLADVWSGWGRSIGLPGVEPRHRIVLDACLLTLTMPLPLWRTLTRRGDALDLCLLAMRFGVAAGTRRAYRPAGPPIWSAPFLDAAAIALVARAAVRRLVTWRGRRIPIR
jgi:dolichol-phosphate mannosyltransferase